MACMGCLAVSGCVAEQYVCADDSSCPGGWCEADDFCSFPDPQCPSERRYGEFSGPNANACVDADGGGGSGGGGSSGASPMGSSSAGSSTDPGVTTDAPCSTPCAEPPPTQWQGPVVLREDDGRGCGPVASSGVAFEAAVGFSGSWSCACECDLFVDDDCGGEVEVEFYDSNNCSGTPDTVTSVGPNCAPVDIDVFFGGSLLPIAPVGAVCSAQAQMQRAPVVPDEVVVACDVLPSAVCDAGACPPADQGDVCIWREGVHACPGGTYADLREFYRSVDDQRDCTPCECTVEGSCGGGVMVGNVLGCGSVTAPFGECTSIGAASPERAQATFEPGPLQCVDSGSRRAGALVGADPVTVCCAG